MNIKFEKLLASLSEFYWNDDGETEVIVIARNSHNEYHVASNIPTTDSIHLAAEGIFEIGALTEVVDEND